MKKEEYITTNFNIAVWLLMNRISIKDIDWSKNPRRADFIFDDFEGREELIEEFFKNEKVQSYISSSQELKARMYATNSPKQYDRKSE